MISNHFRPKDTCASSSFRINLSNFMLSLSPVCLPLGVGTSSAPRRDSSLSPESNPLPSYSTEISAKRVAISCIEQAATSRSPRCTGNAPYYPKLSPPISLSRFVASRKCEASSQATLRHSWANCYCICVPIISKIRSSLKRAKVSK
jgi:hypothetical protein